MPPPFKFPSPNMLAQESVILVTGGNGFIVGHSLSMLSLSLIDIAGRSYGTKTRTERPLQNPHGGHL